MLPLIGLLSEKPLLMVVVGFLIWLAKNFRVVDLMSYIGRSKKIVMYGRIVQSQSYVFCHMSGKMKGLIYFVHKRLDDIGESIRRVEEVPVVSGEGGNTAILNVCIQSNWPVDLGNGMFLKISKNIDNTGQQRNKEDFSPNNRITSVEMELSSSFNSKYSDMMKFVDSCEADYIAHKTYSEDRQIMFVFSSLDADTRRPVLEERPYVSNKTFTNLFFPGKMELLKRIDAFTCGQAEYDRLGLPYKLIMLFHGLPGCGKTSTIKAIANHTKRHVIVVRMDAVKDIEVFRSIILAPKVNDVPIPYDERLYVIEEIDCWLDSIKQRSTTKTKKDDCKKEPDGAMALVSMLMEASCSPAEQNASQLGGLLELLDGLVEMPGIMMVLTTNHVEKLDAALIRPGRIDVNHCFTRMSRSDVRDAYNLWFRDELPSLAYGALKDYTYSQAELAELFFQGRSVALQKLA